MLLRRFAWAIAEIGQGKYVEFRSRMLADNLPGSEGLLVGVVGFGTIGTRGRAGLPAHGVPHRFLRSGAAATSHRRRRWAPDRCRSPELLAAADVVTLHVPLIAATRGMIGDAELAAMKPGAVLIQAARGGIVDEAALARHLASGHLGGAAVDVYSTEPPAADNPLLALAGEGARRLLLTPHIAGVTRQSSALLFRSAWQNVERVLVRGEPPLHRVY